jgi:hypothetical protein
MGLPTRLPVDNLNGPERFLAPNQILGPPMRVQDWIDKLRSRVCFVKQGSSSFARG